mmetsp:Transcript_33833/g.75681  ORF Transcript_33833/g.75681 Transcript_33833/m.75681 type:complete len:157 (+) Transcript_33833:788-1258(+)
MSDCKKHCESITFLLPVHEQSLSLEEVVQRERASQGNMTVLFRLLGWLLLWVGLELVLSPIYYFFSWLWFLGSILAFGLCCCTFLTSMSCSVLVVAAAWLRYRPFMAIMLMLAVVLMYGALFAYAEVNPVGPGNPDSINSGTNSPDYTPRPTWYPN